MSLQSQAETWQQRTSLPEAVQILTESLKGDPDFYYSWQANIAQAFFEEYVGCPVYVATNEVVHQIANEAAKNFLDMLIRFSEDSGQSINQTELKS